MINLGGSPHKNIKITQELIVLDKEDTKSDNLKLYNILPIPNRKKSPKLKRLYDSITEGIDIDSKDVKAEESELYSVGLCSKILKLPKIPYKPKPKELTLGIKKELFNKRIIEEDNRIKDFSRKDGIKLEQISYDVINKKTVSTKSINRISKSKLDILSLHETVNGNNNCILNQLNFKGYKTFDGERVKSIEDLVEKFRYSLARDDIIKEGLSKLSWNNKQIQKKPKVTKKIN
ncbi:hypothetical protein K502DRAFT_342007 [Neoconidiobolus thromboides FSU 785]|nr:hypothetical protein K502DRAFT_342007 [Neoconidiobolus thromboides FSU 785]